MIYKFEVIVETDDVEVDAEKLIDEIQSNLEFSYIDLGVKFVSVKEIE